MPEAAASAIAPDGRRALGPWLRAAVAVPFGLAALRLLAAGAAPWRDGGAVLGLVVLVAVFAAACFGPWTRWRLPAPLVAGVALIVALALCGAAAPLIAPGDPALPVGERAAPPGAGAWFGTDENRRDVFARVIHGTRLTLAVGVLAVLIAAGLGTLVGALAGLAGGAVDVLLMRGADVLLAIPRLLLVLAVVVLLRERAPPALRVWLVVAILSGTGWMPMARVVRAEVLAVREREFVLAARALGLPFHRVLLGHVLPACLPVLAPLCALGLSSAVLLEATLSFLGRGAPLGWPSWGAMVDDGRSCLHDAWWVSLFPGVFIALTALAGHLLADGFSMLLDPRSSARPAVEQGATA